MLWHIRMEKLKSGNGGPANACQAGRPRRKAHVHNCECDQNCTRSRSRAHSHSQSHSETRTHPRTKSFNCLWPRMCECDCPSFSFAARVWIRFGLVSCWMWAQLIFVAYMQHVIARIMMMQMAMPYAPILCNPWPDKCPTWPLCQSRCLQLFPFRLAIRSPVFCGQPGGIISISDSVSTRNFRH